MKNRVVFKKFISAMVSTAILFSCFSGSVLAEGTAFSITKTYMNLFDNEASTTNSEITSIDDVYSYYDFAPSAYYGSVVERQTKRITTSYGKTFIAEPLYSVGGAYGNNSDGAMLLSYGGNQVAGEYARFRIWDNQSSMSTVFYDDSTKPDFYNNPSQLIEANNNEIVYRISFDYKVEASEGYTGTLNYFNGANRFTFPGDNLDNLTLTVLAEVSDTAGQWKQSGYTYVQAAQWTVASICLKMDDSTKSQGTKVYIDNLKVEETNVKSLDNLYTLTLKDTDGSTLKTVLGMPGESYTLPTWSKAGYTFNGWKDAENNTVTSIEFNQKNVEYTATWTVNAYKVTETYMNTFDNEEHATDSTIHSITDVYSYYGYAPSSFEADSTEVPRKQAEMEVSGTTFYGTGISYGTTFKAAPAIDPNAIDDDDSTKPTQIYGKDSLGSMMLSYNGNQNSTNGLYARFIIWNNKSTKDIFESFGNELRAAQTIAVSSSTPDVYRISFDYKVEAEEGYTGGLYYYNATPGVEFNTSNLNNDTLTELARVSDTDGEWKHSGYTYALSEQWENAAIALKMDDDSKSNGTKVYIDNLKLEVIDAHSLENMVTINFNDGDTQIATVSGLRGLDCYVETPKKYGYTFTGWKDSANNPVSLSDPLDVNATYYASWEFTVLGIKGDVTSDNYVDIIDLVRLKKYIAGVQGSVVDVDNELMTMYLGDSAKIAALRGYLLSGNWITSNIGVTYAQGNNNYQYVWGDEFNGNTLDSSKWQIMDHNSSYTKYSDIYFSSDADVINVSGGALNLNCVNNTDVLSQFGVKCKAPNSVMTAGTMNFKYGYIELRANIPIKTGATPGFWLKGNNGAGDKSYVLARGSCTDYMTEIDAFEASSYFDNSITPNLHKWFNGGTNTNYNKIVKGNQFKYTFKQEEINQYHIYGFKWTENEIVMSVDGVDYATFNLNENFDSDDTTDMSGFKDPSFLILSSQMVSPEMDSSLTYDEFSSNFSIDWIRLFQTGSSSALYVAEN